MSKLSGKKDQTEYIIVQIDAFTKFACVFGVLTRIIADHGRSFTGSNFGSLCSIQKFELHLIATGARCVNG